MAGYVRLFATLRITLHFVALVGATNLPATMLHVPVSLQVFFPLEGVVTIFDSVVFERFFTVVVNTLKPGRAVNTDAADTFPDGAIDTTSNV